MIYLDNGATSMPKPRAVINSVGRALRSYASPGRGSSKASEGAEELLYELRETAGEMFGCKPEQVVLTSSATHGLNIAIKSLAGRGSRVVVSGMEHNAVMRPLYAIGAEVDIARGVLFDRDKLLEELDRKLKRETDLCVMNHVSNVFGWVQPVEEAAKMCRDRGVPFVLDASQSAGTQSIDMEALGAAFIAMPGHKGLLGPAGTGLLLCGQETKTLMEGGTGSLSRELSMPEFLPDRLEPGTHNIPGAAGLLAGMRFVRQKGTKRIQQHEQGLGRLAAMLLREIPSIKVFTGEDQSGVLSFLPGNRDCVLFGETLAKKWNIALRAGLHCAPVAHETAGTLESGTIRLSPGPFSTERDIRFFARAVKNEMENGGIIVKKQ